jgi:hypothetical protein
MAEFQFISFFTNVIPEYCDRKAPAGCAMRLARELFGLAEADFNPKHTGRFYGQGKYGFTFEVQVKNAQAQTLAGKNHPNVYHIYE